VFLSREIDSHWKIGRIRYIKALLLTGDETSLLKMDIHAFMTKSFELRYTCHMVTNRPKALGEDVFGENTVGFLFVMA
jgi:hypothetical protein